MACPFFLPTKKSQLSAWPHPSRLPLGAGWDGRCGAPGHEGAEPTDQEITELCNLGYATSCPRLPVERAYDAVRFSIVRDCGSKLDLWFVCEAGHRPAAHGTLEYDILLAQWVSSHADPRIQKMAECYLQSYMLRRIQPATSDHPSTNL